MLGDQFKGGVNKFGKNWKMKYSYIYRRMSMLRNLSSNNCASIVREMRKGGRLGERHAIRRSPACVRIRRLHTVSC